MSDYRNLPFKFAYGGLNGLAAPENIPPGQWSRFVNVRYRRDGTLEARPGTESFVGKFTQPAIGGIATPFPEKWDIRSLVRAAYVGDILNNGTAIDGYLFIYSGGYQGSSSNNPSNYVTFLNGVPIAEMESGCTTFTAFNPTGFSVVRTTTPKGIPVVIIDGSHYILPRSMDIAAPDHTLLNYRYGSYVDDPTYGDVPLFFAYKLGGETPTAVTTADSGSGSGLTGSYYWAITYYNSSSGFESPLGAASTVLSITDNAASITNIPVSTDLQWNSIRLYRKGGTLTTWRLVTTLSNNACVGGTTTYTDSTTDAALSLNQLGDSTSAAPFSTVNASGGALTRQEFNQAWGPFIGKYVFWVGDPVKKSYVCWSRPGDSSRYDPIDDVIGVSDPGEELQNGFVFGGLPYVFSKLNLYGLDYQGPGAAPAFSPRHIPIGMGLAGKWAFAVGPNAVYFLGRDGIYMTDCQPGPPVSLTETTLKPLFQGRAVAGLQPIDINNVDNFRMAVTGKELHFFYIQVGSEPTVTRHLVYDFERGAWSSWEGTSANLGKYGYAYSDEGYEASRIIFGKEDTFQWGNNIYSLDDTRPDSGTETFNVLARTGAVDMEIPVTFKEFGVLQLDADYDGVPLTITPYYNSETVTGTNISALPDISENPSRRAYAYTLGDFYGRSLSLEFSWTESPTLHPILYQGNLLFREDEEAITHWEQPPSSLGTPGWFHIKDADFCIRSTDEVTLTVVIDGTTTDTYYIASTGGERLKRYVEFRPRRGKVFQFKLDSKNPPTDGTINPKPFRFYGEDSVLRGKPWVTGASYQALTPFGNVGYAQYRRTEGGT